MAHPQESIKKIRKFNRFYTNVIGLLDQHFLDTPFSLTEGRVLYEISQMEECSARKIMENITIDEGYLSRIIHKFTKQGLIKKTPSAKDKRLHIIVLTENGRREFQKLNDNSNKSISQMIAKLSQQESAELVGMMERLQDLLLKNGEV
jgi:DNA-binding MarR family transcriptional regulator